MKKMILALVAFFAMVGTAQAYNYAPDYVTGSVTRSDIDLEVSGFGTINIDKTTGYSVGAGKNIFGKKWLAAELNYSQTGEASIGGVDLGEVKSLGVYLVATPTLFKINHKAIKAIAAVGGVYNNVNVHGVGNFYDTGIAYRAGLSMEITKNIEVFADYKKMDVDLVTGIDLEINTVGAGLKYNF